MLDPALLLFVLGLGALRHHDLSLAKLLFAGVRVWNVHLRCRNEGRYAIEVRIEFFEGDPLGLWEECLSMETAVSIWTCMGH